MEENNQHTQTNFWDVLPSVVTSICLTVLTVFLMYFNWGLQCSREAETIAEHQRQECNE